MCVCVCVCCLCVPKRERVAFVQCVLAPHKVIRTWASTSLSMIRAIAANHCRTEGLHAGNVPRGCNHDEGSMVELAEILMRPRGSAIVTRVSWFDGRQVRKFRDFCV